MRNLFAFLFRFHVFFLFLILQIICVALMVQNSNFHHAAFLNVSDEVVGRSFSVYNEVTEYLRLGDENKKLAAQNAELMNHLPSSYYDDSTHTIVIADSAKHRVYSYIPARVIQSTTNQSNNYIMIDKGRLQGITPLMAVIGANGVIGVVKNTTDHFADVQSLLHSQTTVNGRVRRNGEKGSIHWDGTDVNFVSLDEVGTSEHPQKGDTIFTSGQSRMYPENIPIGTIENFDYNGQGNFYRIKVRLLTDFKKLDYVYVVNNHMGIEMDSLLQKEDHGQ